MRQRGCCSVHQWRQGRLLPRLEQNRSFYNTQLVMARRPRRRPCALRLAARRQRRSAAIRLRSNAQLAMARRFRRRSCALRRAAQQQQWLAAREQSLNAQLVNDARARSDAAQRQQRLAANCDRMCRSLRCVASDGARERSDALAAAAQAATRRLRSNEQPMRARRFGRRLCALRCAARRQQ